MTAEKIVKLDQLLNGYIGDSKSIVDTKFSRLTAPGENYGSILLKVDITLENKKDNSREELHTVAKLIPEDEFFQKMFNVQVSCKVEISFYDTIVPTLQRFQKEKGVQQVMDFFPKMYASRLNLNGSDTVDQNAVLLLENLIEAGYKNVDRFESFDLPTVKVVLKDLAVFHAVPLALKLLEPETFQSKIRPYLVAFQPPPPEAENPDGKQFTDSFEIVFDFLEADEECRPVVPLLREKSKLRPEPDIHQNEPWATMGHGDFWINNTMVKFEEGRPVANKMVDFQNPRYLSPAVDLFFLLWSSVKLDVLDEHYDNLVQFYHENFIKQLKELQCDTSPFTLERFLEEVKQVADTEVMHNMFFSVFIIFAKKNESGPPKMPHELEPEDVTEIGKERIIHFIRACKRKGWL
ncbi:uncharacterized protein LOC108904287 isoform X1 [Anoplophora glabripennis]|uniref:uncharacterized protein LOC108904287 isoform X1 n=1 Tax=Anoplophora glabripennis TaxID=217634 RepID=UPI000873836C|nr:uncharacterized protein LOC108904287 isoform X1 [Anoplophora glabripennis]